MEGNFLGYQAKVYFKEGMIQKRELFLKFQKYIKDFYPTLINISCSSSSEENNLLVYFSESESLLENFRRDMEEKGLPKIIEDIEIYTFNKDHCDSRIPKS